MIRAWTAIALLAGSLTFAWGFFYPADATSADDSRDARSAIALRRVAALLFPQRAIFRLGFGRPRRIAFALAGRRNSDSIRLRRRLLAPFPVRTNYLENSRSAPFCRRSSLRCKT